MKIKYIWLTGSLVLVLFLTSIFSFAKELTPKEFVQLSTADRLKAKKIVVRILPMFAVENVIDFESEKATINGPQLFHIGEPSVARFLLSRDLFELKHPNVKITVPDFPTFTYKTAKQVILTAIAAGNAPAYHWAYGGLAGWVEQGLAADMSWYFNEHPFLQEILKKYGKKATYCWEGKPYYIPQNKAPALVSKPMIRKDWFKEAGIFNEFGEPAPPLNWTVSDFRSILKKLTNPKKKRWGALFARNGSGWMFETTGGELITRYSGYGADECGRVPDKENPNYLWKYSEDLPTEIEFFKTVNDIVFKDKSVMVGTETSWTGEFQAGRVGMCIVNLTDIVAAASSPHYLDPNIPSYEQVGMATIPLMPAGIHPGPFPVGGPMFSNALSKEELRAAADWLIWEEFGVGAELKYKMLAEMYRMGAYIPSVSDVDTITDLPQKAGLPTVEEVLPTENIRRVYRYMRSYPPPRPRPDDYGLGAGLHSNTEQRAYGMALWEKAQTDPNFDAATEVRNTAKLMNEARIPVKVENAKEKYQQFIKDLDKWFREYYPDYWKSEQYKNLMDKYYRWE